MSVSRETYEKRKEPDASRKFFHLKQLKPRITVFHVKMFHVKMFHVKMFHMKHAKTVKNVSRENVSRETCENGEKCFT